MKTAGPVSSVDQHDLPMRTERRIGNPSRNSYCPRAAASSRRGYAEGTARGSWRWYSGHGEATQETAVFCHSEMLAFDPVGVTSFHIDRTEAGGQRVARDAVTVGLV
ncbi:hypothetical protein [Sphingomonas insulae]|uniref:hypothetical protein n=1 Tax=Sphingomonas insulae TaxID=424800 RepID=UPI0013D02C88|nr:hypothetical protein [Sphingomonas insulae]